MKTVLIIHGITGHAGIHWQGWLADELEKKGYGVIMPEMPEPDHPNRTTWLEKVKKITKNVEFSELIIVAHSLGVPTALDFIETTDKKIKAMVSVSGFADDYGAELNSYFMAEKDIDFDKVSKNLEKAFVLYGDDDPYVPQVSLAKLAKELKVKPIIIKNGGHLNTRAGYQTFPEIQELLLSLEPKYQIHKAGGILIKDKKLLVEKSPHREFWIAPGGKLEGNESPKESLKRELWEEFHIKANKEAMNFFGSFYAVAAGDKKKRVVKMDVFIVKKWKGNPKPNAEVEEVKWITSKIPKGMKVGSIFEYEVIPRLKKKGLIK